MCAAICRLQKVGQRIRATASGETKRSMQPCRHARKVRNKGLSSRLPPRAHADDCHAVTLLGTRRRGLQQNSFAFFVLDYNKMC